MIQVRIRSFYVGFGSANVIEVNVDGTNHYILLDFGTAGHAEETPNAPADTAYTRIGAINGGIFHSLIFTHLDKDHITEVVKLIEGGLLRQAGNVYIGGTKSHIRGFADIPRINAARGRRGQFVPRLVRGLVERNVCLQADIHFISDNIYQTPIIQFDDAAGAEKFSIKVLASRNCTANDESIYINSNSAVLIAEYEAGGQSRSVCFTGDATNNTFVYINRKMAAHIGTDYDELRNPAQSKAMIIPHHGSLKTACPEEKIVETRSIFDQLTECTDFGNMLSAKAGYVSAYYSTFHAHPELLTMEAFCSHADILTVLSRKMYFIIRIDENQCPDEDEVKDLYCEETSSAIYTSFAYDQDFALIGAVGKDRDPDYRDSGTDIATYPRICGEFICRLGSGVPNLFDYNYVTL